MDGSKKDLHSVEAAGHSAPVSQHEEKETPVISPRRLRDRELLKRKKEESQEKDNYFEQNQTRSKRPRQTRGTGSRRGRKTKEPEQQLEAQPEPEPVTEPDHKHEQTPELHHEVEPKNEPDHNHKQGTEKQDVFEPENKLVIHDVPQELSQHEQEHLEPLEHHDDPVITVSEGGNAADIYAVHEEADGHFQQDIPFFKTDKEEVAEVEPEPLIGSAQVLSFPLQGACTPEQEEHQYYTPLL